MVQPHPLPVLSGFPPSEVAMVSVCTRLLITSGMMWLQLYKAAVVGIVIRRGLELKCVVETNLTMLALT